MTEMGTEEKADLKNLISKNVSVNLASKVLYLLTRFFLPPLTLSYVTLEEYGIWAACFILIGYLGMSAFGVSNVYIRYVAEYNARGETGKINRLLSTGLTVITTLSVALLAALWFLLPVVIKLLRIPPQFSHTGFVLIFVTAATFMLDLTFGAFSYVLAGLQRMVEQTVVWVLSFCLEAVLIVTLLLSGAGIYALLWAFVIRYVLATAAYVALCYRAIPGLSLSVRHFDKSVLRLFFGYGAIVQVSGLLGMFLYSIEKVIAGVFIGVSATGIVDIGEKLPVMASQITGSMNSVFLPAMSHMQTLGRKEEIAKLYLKGARYMNLMMGFLLGFLAAFSHVFIRAWVGSGERFFAAATILALVCLPYQMNELTGPSSAFHRGTGHPIRELVYPITQLLLVVSTVAIGFIWIGKTVLVIVTAIAISMVTSALVYILYTNRFLGVSFRTFAAKVLAPGVVPYLIGFALASVARPFTVIADNSRWAALGFLAVCGIIYAPICLFTLYRGMCDWGEREFLRKQLIHTVTSLMRRQTSPPAPVENLKVEGA
jgi:O-antigen/teichoic acid export membrane protein